MTNVGRSSPSLTKCSHSSSTCAEFDLGGEWDRISMYDSLSAASGRTITPETSIDELRALAAEVGVEVPEKVATHAVVDPATATAACWMSSCVRSAMPL
jgi:lysyl-tRNA synthetase class II